MQSPQSEDDHRRGLPGGVPEGRRLEIVTAAEMDSAGRGIKPGDPVEILIDYGVKRVRRRQG